jgi:hypothetical protein
LGNFWYILVAFEISSGRTELVADRLNVDKVKTNFVSQTTKKVELAAELFDGKISFLQA